MFGYLSITNKPGSLGLFKALQRQQRRGDDFGETGEQRGFRGQQIADFLRIAIGEFGAVLIIEQADDDEQQFGVDVQWGRGQCLGVRVALLDAINASLTAGRAPVSSSAL